MESDGREQLPLIWWLLGLVLAAGTRCSPGIIATAEAPSEQQPRADAAALPAPAANGTAQANNNGLLRGQMVGPRIVFKGMKGKRQSEDAAEQDALEKVKFATNLYSSLKVLEDQQKPMKMVVRSVANRVTASMSHYRRKAHMLKLQQQASQYRDAIHEEMAQIKRLSSLEQQLEAKLAGPRLGSDVPAQTAALGAEPG